MNQKQFVPAMEHSASDGASAASEAEWGTIREQKKLLFRREMALEHREKCYRLREEDVDDREVSVHHREELVHDREMLAKKVSYHHRGEIGHLSIPKDKSPVIGKLFVPRDDAQEVSKQSDATRPRVPGTP